MIKACKTKGADHKVVVGRHLNYRMQVSNHTHTPHSVTNSHPPSLRRRVLRRRERSGWVGSRPASVETHFSRCSSREDRE